MCWVLKAGSPSEENSLTHACAKSCVLGAGTRPHSSWQLRRLPGPKPQWLFGNIFQARAPGNHEYYRTQAKIHGPIFKARRLECLQLVCTCEAADTLPFLQTWGITGAEVIVTSPKLVKYDAG